MRCICSRVWRLHVTRLYQCPDVPIWAPVTNERWPSVAKEGSAGLQVRRQMHYAFVRRISAPFRSSVEKQMECESGPITSWLCKSEPFTC